MSDVEFAVFMGGDRLSLHVSEKGFVLGADSEEAITNWTQVTELHHPNPASVALKLREGKHVQFAFMSRTDRDRFTTLADKLRVPGAAESRASPTSRDTTFPLLTIDHFPGHRVVEFRGLVTSQSVMSRNMFSDIGSDLVSVVGGSLGGMERAVSDAISAARRGLAAAAQSAQADAVIGVTVVVAGLGSKAEAVVMSGTAVKTAAVPGPTADLTEG